MPSPQRLTVTALFALVVMAVSGCDCKGGGGITKTNGELNIAWRDADNNRMLSRDATYDFGYALVGDKKPLTLTVKNTGAGKLTLAKLELTTGDATAIGPLGDADFQVAFTEGTQLGPSEQVEFEMFFTPRGLKGVYESHLTLTAEGTRGEDATAALTLKGGGEKGSCELPDTIDFGKVPVGETLPWPVDFNNPTNVDTTGLAGDITGVDSTAFGYQAGSPHGTVAVPMKTSVPVLLTFSPTEKRVYTAAVQLKGPGPCDTKNVTLRGEGSDDVFSWAPDTLNFGFVSPGFDSVKDVLFTNLSNTPITLTQVTSSLPTDFSHRVAAGADDTRLTVPGNASNFPLHVACSPAGMGPRDATLTFKTPLLKTPTGVIKLHCTGGGPKIKVTPRPTLAFGRVGFFPGSATFNVTRKVNVQNVGSRPATPDPTTNLYLGQADFTVTPATLGGLPLFEVAPANAATEADEFQVALAGTYNPAVGLEPVAGRNYVDIAVTLMPKSIGQKAATLTIYSNDSAEPAITVTVTADVQQLPPCNYRVSPAQANFGLVTPPNTKDLPITITNLGTASTDICYLSGIDLAPGTSPAYTIVGGPVVEKELQPAESWQVVVRVSPPGPVPTTIQSLTGTLLFNASSATAPQAQVPLSTAVGPVCLAVTPDPLDFGNVKIGCNSRERDFSIYNVCNAAVTLTGFSMQAAGGQPAGGPNCPAGGPACPEFRLSSTPSIPAAGLVVNPGGTPVTFRAKYAPLDVGSDQGAVSIAAVQGGQSLSYLVGLTGTGDTSGNQTDTFTQAQKPMADILLVVDDSGSMSDKQTNLANNFGSFIQYAQSAGVDYHLAVVTTSMDEQCTAPPVRGRCLRDHQGRGHHEPQHDRRAAGGAGHHPAPRPTWPRRSRSW